VALITVYDTDGNVPSLPDGVQYALAYDDGSDVGSLLKARFPSCRLITITTVPQANNMDARVCDCEANAFSFDQAAAWAAAKRQRGERPCIYVEVSNKPAVTEALGVYGLEFGRDVDCWLAWWMGQPVIPSGVYNGVGCGDGNVACQYWREGPLTYDVSVALEAWAFPTQKEAEVLFIKEQSGEVYWFIAAGAQSYWRLVPPKAVGMLPTSWLVPDDGSWLALWKVA
jgi:hypothetical protein